MCWLQITFYMESLWTPLIFFYLCSICSDCFIAWLEMPWSFTEGLLVFSRFWLKVFIMSFFFFNYYLKAFKGYSASSTVCWWLVLKHFSIMQRTAGLLLILYMRTSILHFTRTFTSIKMWMQHLNLENWEHWQLYENYFHFCYTQG